MSESICKFVPQGSSGDGIRTVRFVYETEWYTLSFPQISPVYLLAIVTRGSGILHTEEKTYPLSRGDLFFLPPATAFSLSGDRALAYIYITFLGTDVPSLLARMGLTEKAPYFPAREELCPTFESAIHRADPANIAILSESTLRYALSFLAEKGANAIADDGAFTPILNYVDAHFSDKDLSLRTLAERFSYTEKYLSVLFKKCVGIGFHEYLIALRMQHANRLMEAHFGTIAEIADAAGFKDASYFSKVYKQKTGITPQKMLHLIGVDRKRTRSYCNKHLK